MTKFLHESLISPTFHKVHFIEHVRFFYIPVFWQATGLASIPFIRVIGIRRSLLDFYRTKSTIAIYRQIIVLKFNFVLLAVSIITNQIEIKFIKNKNKQSEREKIQKFDQFII